MSFHSPLEGKDFLVHMIRLTALISDFLVFPLLGSVENFFCEITLELALAMLSHHEICINRKAWGIGCPVNGIFRAPPSDHKSHFVSSLVVNIFPKIVHIHTSIPANRMWQTKWNDFDIS